MFKQPSAGFHRVVGIAQAIVLSLTLSSSVQAQTTQDSGSSNAVASVVSQKRTSRTVTQDAEGGAVAPSGPVAKPSAATTRPQPEPADQKQLQPLVDRDAEQQADDGSQEMVSAPPEGEAMLRVRISVPHQTRPVSSITLYPYPPRPPRMIRPISKLDDSPKTIRSQLLSLGYSSRSSESKLFPTAGWRWQYILRAALQTSGTRPPTNILTMYPWTHKMVPYVQAEVRRINDIEADRKIRYQSALKDFEENGIELENEAVQKGLSPIEINLRSGSRQLQSGMAVVSPGTWYIVAAHKTSNLKFFWQIPVTLSAGEKSTVQLTQTNALVIEGGW